MNDNHDFSDIAPYDDAQFKEKMAKLAKEPLFEHAIKYLTPDIDYKAFAAALMQIPDKETFQSTVMYKFISMLEDKTTLGVTVSGIDKISADKQYTFISNHRDIVLDACFLNLCLFRSGFPTIEVAIGNNLLIHDWITDLVKLNKSFIVKRNLRAMEALDAAKHLSAYIHYAINEKHQGIWIAHREGRAKDSNDLTQESLIKMLALAGTGTIAQRLEDINLCPVSISYEYDPNDYLKAREFLLKRDNPSYRKTESDDLKAMETGLLCNKGHVHFNIGGCINGQLKPMLDISDRNKVVKSVCGIIDRSIHQGYKIYPVNYIAYDLLEVTDMHRDRYTEAQMLDFRNYVESQLDKTQVPDLTAEQRGYMYRMILTMYANPLRNKLKAEAEPNPEA